MANPTYGLRPELLVEQFGSSNWSINGGTTEVEVLSDESDSSYLRGITTGVGLHIYRMEDLLAPTGATIASVKILLRVQRLLGGNTLLTSRIQFPAGSTTQKSVSITSAGFKDIVFDYTTSRPGGGTWTSADFVNIEGGISYSGASLPADFRVYRFRLEVGLTAASLPTPSVVSSGFTNLTSTSVRLEATINPNGSTIQFPTFWTFEYDVPNPPIEPDPEESISGSTAQAVVGEVQDLDPGAIYTFRARIHKGDATYIYGSSQNYSTLEGDRPIFVL